MSGAVASTSMCGRARHAVHRHEPLAARVGRRVDGDGRRVARRGAGEQRQASGVQIERGGLGRRRADGCAHAPHAAGETRASLPKCASMRPERLERGSSSSSRRGRVGEGVPERPPPAHRPRIRLRDRANASTTRASSMRRRWGVEGGRRTAGPTSDVGSRQPWAPSCGVGGSFVRGRLGAHHHGGTYENARREDHRGGAPVGSPGGGGDGGRCRDIAATPPQTRWGRIFSHREKSGCHAT